MGNIYQDDAGPGANCINTPHRTNERKPTKLAGQTVRPKQAGLHKTCTEENQGGQNSGDKEHQLSQQVELEEPLCTPSISNARDGTRGTALHIPHPPQKSSGWLAAGICCGTHVIQPRKDV